MINNEVEKPFIIAIDGPAGSGKGAISKLIAEKYDLKYIQSGCIYRAIAYSSIENNIKSDDVEAVIEIAKIQTDIFMNIAQYDHYMANRNINGQSLNFMFCKFDDVQSYDIRSNQISNFASQIAPIVNVRASVNKFVKYLIDNSARAIIEGRDTTTVVAPNADLKIFLTASVEVRARRRMEQLEKDNDIKYDLQEIISSIEKRDNLDMNRSASPLRIAEDAEYIDTSELNIQEVIKKISSFID